MRDDLAGFLGSVGVLERLAPETLGELAATCDEHDYAPGERLLRLGQPNDRLMFLRSGRLVVRVGKGEARITVAVIEPPGIVGELSFLTGRACSADVEALTPARVVRVSTEALAGRPALRNLLLQRLSRLLAERLHDVVSERSGRRTTRIVRLRCGVDWEAPTAFAGLLARGLATREGLDTLLVEAGDAHPWDLRERGPRQWSVVIPPAGGQAAGEAVSRLGGWRERFGAIVIPESAVPQEARSSATHSGTLLGPGESPPETTADDFVVQDRRGARLPFLAGGAQLIADVEAAERAWRAGSTVPAEFERVAGSVARFLTGRQVGLALGGGGAWGWVHAGVLDVLEGAGLPVDVITGCSMGSIVGSLRASGLRPDALAALAIHWSRRYWRLANWRIWRLHLANDRAIARVITSLTGNRAVNETVVPFWANAADLDTGGEVVIRDGPLADAVRASMAFPGWAPPVQRDGRLLVDAAFLRPVPASAAREMGAGFVLAVSAIGPGTPRPARHTPVGAYDLLMRCARMAGHEIGRLHGDVIADVTLTPDFGDTSMLSWGRGDALVEAGRRAAAARVEEIVSRYNAFLPV